MIGVLCQVSNLSAILSRELVMIQRDDPCLVLDQHAELAFQCASTRSNGLQEDMSPHSDCRKHYSDSEPTSLCSCSLMLCA